MIGGNHEGTIKTEFRENGFFVNGLSILGEGQGEEGGVRFFEKSNRFERSPMAGRFRGM